MCLLNAVALNAVLKRDHDYSPLYDITPNTSQTSDAG